MKAPCGLGLSNRHFQLQTAFFIRPKVVRGKGISRGLYLWKTLARSKRPSAPLFCYPFPPSCPSLKVGHGSERRNTPGTVRDPRPPRRRRDGRGLPRPGHAPRAGGGGEGPAPAPHRFGGGARPLRARGPHPVEPQPPP